ncbi:MAG: hypothetical protein JJ896_08465 [Rhodothermales bacterium]|nr:hypothetical protein [Rhodothermales bacterium]MBO6779676.1 hypothetical protein [Rhodothermales bacterium]
MPLILYKVLHLLGLMLVFAALGGAAIEAALKEKPWKKMHAILHGSGLFLLLLGGFGMLARLGIISGWPGWVWAKLAIWVILGGSLTAMRKMPERGRPLLFGAILLGTLAAYLALYKPF